MPGMKKDGKIVMAREKARKSSGHDHRTKLDEKTVEKSGKRSGNYAKAKPEARPGNKAGAGRKDPNENKEAPRRGANRPEAGGEKNKKMAPGAKNWKDGQRKTWTGKNAEINSGTKKYKTESDRSGSVQVKREGGKEHEKKRQTVGKYYEKTAPGKKQNHLCPVFSECGGCQLLDMPYEKQLEKKKADVEILLKKHCPVRSITGMENPFHYRNKVHAVFAHEKGKAVSGVYQANSHIVVPVENCLIEDKKADEIIGTIRGMLKSFKIKTYDEDTDYGLLRHVLVRRGFATGQIMVVLVTASPIFPSKNNFVKVLREKHPEITTIIQNINDRQTSMVLGDREKVFFGKGFIEDELGGCTFRISSKSFYQVNPVQTELLYKKAVELAELKGTETVIDAYCGIGTIGIIASQKAGQVIGVELNQDAVQDARENARRNHCSNISFYCNDAGKFMLDMAQQGESADVVFLDPPRSGSTEEFISNLAVMKPKRVVYVSCDPVTLERDLGLFEKKGYEAKGAWIFDLFPFTTIAETVCILTRKA